MSLTTTDKELDTILKITNDSQAKSFRSYCRKKIWIALIKVGGVIAITLIPALEGFRLGYNLIKSLDI